MEYSAGMVSQLFALVEAKKTAELMTMGLSRAQIREKVMSENLYQLKNETRLRKTFNYVYKRLDSLPEGAVDLLVKVDTENAKLLTLISIMNTDKLFFEFVYEVYRGKIILGEKSIETRDINVFFDEKARQSEEVSSWSESAIKKLKQCYIKNLVDAGLLDSTKNREIKHALVNYRIEELLSQHGMKVHISAVKGV
ncbi:DUF1819 family protein [Lacrimispora sp.]|uniref:DUF1819 family protein n=1 Tax=Lacrimispora sp. TaxID=2719234 RepID=UPI0028A7EAB2|nr:DUF1819 family protein [Lacrimispora sp.]